MKKRLISFILAIALLCAMLPQIALFSTSAPLGGYEYYRHLYKEYLLSTKYSDLLDYDADPQKSMIDSALVDMNSDGVYELLLAYTDTSGFGVRGYPTYYCLFSVVNNKITVLFNAYYGGGSMGGDRCSFTYDPEKEKCVLRLDSIFISGMPNYVNSSAFFEYSNNSLNMYIRFDSYNYSKEQYKSVYDKIKAETSYIYEDDFTFQFYQIDEKYVSENTFNSQLNKFPDSTGTKYELKQCSYEDPIATGDDSDSENNEKKAIIVIPGITGSELWGYVGNNYKKVWLGEGALDGLLGDVLQCEEDGSSIPEYVITAPYPRDDSSSFGTLGTYTSLVQRLQQTYDADFGGSGEYDVRFFAYDWRLTNTLAADKLKQFIADYNEVILVCHSMGGIVASLYMAEYGTKKIDKLITLGTPYYGAPKAVYAQETGHFLDGIPGIITSDIIKKLIPNMPGVYELIPTPNYFKNGNYYITNAFTDVGQDYNQTKTLISKENWFNSAVYKNTESVFSQSYTNGTIDSVYNKIISGEIDSYIIVGYNQKTLTCMSTKFKSNYSTGIEIDDVDINLTGDGTVPLISSTFNYAKMNRSPYYIDGKNYLLDKQKGINHTALAGDSRVINLVVNIINGNGDTSDYNKGCDGIVSRNITVKKGFTGYKIIAACPVEVTFYSKDGTWLGTLSSETISSASGNENDFYLCGENNETKIAFLDYNYVDIEIIGYDNGSMDFSIEKYDDGKKLDKIDYSGIQITEHIRIETNTNISDDPHLNIDTNNDGKIDSILSPDLNIFTDCGGNAASCPSAKFTDVAPYGDWSHNGIDFCLDRGLFGGASATTFEPETAMNRAMLVTVLWRYEGSPKGYTNNFRDVVNGEWYADAVSWAAANGIVNGVENGRFDPDGIVTREQMATILYRYSDWKGFDTSARADFSSFPDASKVGSWAKTAMQWAVAEGLIGGSKEGGKTYILPSDGATRAQVATILMRYIQTAGYLYDDYDSEYRIAMITDINYENDPYFYDAYEGVRKWSEENNAEFIWCTSPYPNTLSYVETIKYLKDIGYNVIILEGYQYAEAIAQVAGKYPDVYFICLDLDPNDIACYPGAFDHSFPKNVFCTLYQEELSGFMAGYAAVKLGYTKLGFLGGMENAAVIRYGYGFIQGVDKAASESGIKPEVRYVYANRFYGDADVTAYMENWYRSGTQVVFSCGGGAYTSVAKAAQKYRGKVIGVDVDQADQIDSVYGAGITLTSARKGLGESASYILEEMKNGKWNLYGGECHVLGLRSGVDPSLNFVGLSTSTQWGTGFNQADYKELVRKLYSGTYSVSASTDVKPTVSSTTVKYEGEIPFS